MSYVRAKIDNYNEEKLYRVYVTDFIRVAVDHNGVSPRYIELLQHPGVEDTRTGDEVAADVIARAGLSFAERSESD